MFHSEIPPPELVPQLPGQCARKSMANWWNSARSPGLQNVIVKSILPPRLYVLGYIQSQRLQLPIIADDVIVIARLPDLLLIRWPTAMMNAGSESLMNGTLEPLDHVLHVFNPRIIVQSNRQTQQDVYVIWHHDEAINFNRLEPS